MILKHQARRPQAARSTLGAKALALLARARLSPLALFAALGLCASAPLSAAGDSLANYTQLQYIESDGRDGNYIQLKDFNLSGAFVVKTKFAFNKTVAGNTWTANETIFCNRHLKTDNNATFSLFRLSKEGRGLRFDYRTTSVNGGNNTEACKDNQPHTIVCSSAGLTVDGTDVPNPGMESSYTKSIESTGLILFACDDYKTADGIPNSNFTAGKMYYFKVETSAADSTPILNLVPVKEKTGGTRLGMYDTVGNQFYPVSGTFTAPLMYKVGKDDSETSSFTKSDSTSSGWSTTQGGTVDQGHTVSADYDYIVPSGAALRTIYDNDDDKFAGKSLTIDGGMLMLKSQNIEKSKTIEINSLTLQNGGSIAHANDKTTYTFSKSVTIPANQTGVISIREKEARHLVLSGGLAGGGTLQLNWGWGGTVKPENQDSQLKIAGDSSGFTGTLTAVGDGNLGTDGFISDTKYTLILDGQFGGTITSLPNAKTNAIKVNYDNNPGLTVATTAIPAALKTDLVFYGSTSFTAANLPLITFPAETTVNPTDFTIKYATAVDGTATSFTNLGTVTHGDGTITLVAKPQQTSIENATVTYSPESATYDGSVQTPTVTVTLDGVNITAYCNVSWGSQELKNASSSYTPTITAKADSQYTGNVTSPAQFTIAQRVATLQWSNDSIEYDGQAHKPICEVSNLVQGDSCTVTLTTASSRSAVGTWPADAASLNNDNYKLPSSGRQHSFEITKRTVTLQWGDTTFTYDGQPHAPTCTAGSLVGSEVCNVTVTGAAKDVGTYTATASGLTGANAGNYQLPTEITCQFTITAPLPDVNFTASRAENMLTLSVEPIDRKIPCKVLINYDSQDREIPNSLVSSAGGDYAFDISSLNIPLSASFDVKLVAKYDTLDYVQATGAQRVDVDTVAYDSSKRMRITMTANHTEEGGSQVDWGFLSSKGNYFGIPWKETITARYYHYGNGDGDRTDVDAVDNTLTTYVEFGGGSATKVKIGEYAEKEDTSGPSASASDKLKLFNVPDVSGGTGTYYAKVKLYSLTVTQDNAVIADLVPVKDSGVAKLLDMKTGNVLASATSTALAAGSVQVSTGTVLGTAKAKVSIANATVTYSSPASPTTYNGNKQEPTVTVTLNGVDISTSCTVSWSSQGLKDAGSYTPTVTANAGSSYVGTVTPSNPFTINAKSLTASMVTLSKATAKVNVGDWNTLPTVTVKDGGTTLTENTHYTKSWSPTTVTGANTYTCNITGRGNYQGTVQTTYVVSAADPEPSDLPEGYTKLTYIDAGSDNATAQRALQITNFHLQASYKVATKVYFNSIGGGVNNAVFCNRDNSKGQYALLALGSNWRYDYLSAVSSASTRTSTSNFDAKQDLVITTSPSKVTIDKSGTSAVIEGDAGPSDELTTDLILFAANTFNSADSTPNAMFSNMRMYYFKVTDGSGNVKLNLVPAIRDEDGAVGMYDLIGNMFYGSVGQPFTAGAVDGPVGIKSVTLVNTETTVGADGWQTPPTYTVTSALNKPLTSGFTAVWTDSSGTSIGTFSKAGTYTLTVTGNGTDCRGTKTASFTVKSDPKAVPLPRLVRSSFVFDGLEKTVSFVSIKGFTYDGTLKATEIGEYTITCTLDSGKHWEGGSTEPVKVTWRITAEDTRTFLQRLADDPRKVNSSPCATGGDIILYDEASGDYIHVFTNTAAAGTFKLTGGNKTARILCVGGGGSGGSTYEGASGGGGAGGVTYNAEYSLLQERTYSVYVGKAGVWTTDPTSLPTGADGGNSYLMYDGHNHVLHTGGGGYGQQFAWGTAAGKTGAGSNGNAGGNGGSGGGCGYASSINGGRGGTGLSGGHRGSNKDTHNAMSGSQTGGGGGAHSDGTDLKYQDQYATWGQGGDGVNCDILGFNQVFGGGGSGFSLISDVPGGLGGGGSWDYEQGQPILAEDGLGGGGPGASRDWSTSLDGGSGLVVIRYSGTETATEKTVLVPTAIEGLYYTGWAQTGVPDGFGYTLSGSCRAREAADDYVAVATPEDGYTWPDGSSDPVEIHWSIAKADIGSARGVVIGAPAQMAMGAIVKPTFKFLFNGVEVPANQYQISGWSGELMNLGTYTAIATPTTAGVNFTGAREVTFTIKNEVATYYHVGENASGTSSFDGSSTAAVGWSTEIGGVVEYPHTVFGNCDYVIPDGATVRTHENDNTELFKGASFELQSGGELALKRNGNVDSAVWTSYTKTIEFNRLVGNGGKLTCSTDGAHFLIKTKDLNFKEGGLEIAVSGNNARHITLDATVRNYAKGNLIISTDLGGTGDTITKGITLLGDWSEFTGDIISSDVTTSFAQFHLCVPAAFNGRVRSLPPPEKISSKTLGSTAVIFNYDGFRDQTRGLLIGTNDVAAVKLLKTYLYLITTKDPETPNLPIMTFPAGTEVTASQFTGVRVISSYAANAAPDSGTVLTGMGTRTNEDGTITLYANYINDIAEFDVSCPPQVYTGSELTPVVTVKLAGRTLVEGTDYTIGTWSGGLTAVGDHVATITGAGDYAGTTKGVTFTILSAAAIDLSQNYTFEPVAVDYDGKPHTVAVELTEAAKGATVKYSLTEDGPYTLDQAPSPVLPYNATIYCEISREGSTTVYGSAQLTIRAWVNAWNEAENVAPKISKKSWDAGDPAGTVTDATAKYGVVKSYLQLHGTSVSNLWSRAMPDVPGNYVIYYIPEELPYVTNEGMGSRKIEFTITGALDGTITAPSQTYTGLLLTPTYTVTYTVPTKGVSRTLIKDIDFTEGSWDPAGLTAAGDYQMTLSGIPPYTGSIKVNFKINQAQNEWTQLPSVTPDTWTTTDAYGTLTPGKTKFGTVAATYTQDGFAKGLFPGLAALAADKQKGEFVVTYTAPATDTNVRQPTETTKSVRFTITQGEYSYSKYETLSAAGGAYTVITDVKLHGNDTIDARFIPPASDNAYFWSTETPQAGLYIMSFMSVCYYWFPYGDRALQINSPKPSGKVTDVAVTNGTIWIDGALAKACEPKDFTSEDDITMFAAANKQSAQPATFNHFRIIGTDGQLQHNLVPARRDDNVDGFYDTVTKAFFANANAVQGATLTAETEITVEVAIPELAANTIRETGTEIDILVRNEISVEGMLVHGTTKATEPGDYVFTLTPDDTHVWEGGTFATRTYTWSITEDTREEVKKPYAITPAPQWNGGNTVNGIGYDPTLLDTRYSIGGDGISNSEVGDYLSTAKLLDPENDRWEGTHESELTINWAIVQAVNEWTTELSLPASWEPGESVTLTTPVAKFGSVQGWLKRPGSEAFEKWTPDIRSLSVNGNYQLKFTVEGTAQYSSLEVVQGFRINNGTMEGGIKAENVEVFYDGQPHGLVVTLEGSAADATLKFWNEATSAYDLDVSPTQTAVGVLTVKYQVSKPGKVTVTDSRTVTVKSCGLIIVVH